MSDGDTDKDPKKKPKVSRRTFLKAGAATTAAVGLGSYWSWNHSVKELGDQSYAPSQEQVNDLYAALYDQISSEKQIAEEHKKDMAIIIGEDHIHHDSLLLDMMIVDISNKININHFIAECYKDDKDTDDLNSRKYQYQAYHDDDIREKLTSDIYDHVKRVGRGSYNHRLSSAKFLGKSNDHSGTRCLAQVHGFELHAGDTKYIDGSEASSVREPAMVDAVKKVAGHKLCQFGANHLPALREGLDQHMHVVAINTSNAQGRFSLRGAKASKEFPSIVVEGAEIKPERIVEFLSVASKKHQMDQDGVPAEEQEVEIQALQKEARDMWQKQEQKSSSAGRDR